MNALHMTPWAKALVPDDELACIRSEALAASAHVNLSADSPHGPLYATVWADGPDHAAVEWLRTHGPVQSVVGQLHQALDRPSLPGTCPECGDPLADGYTICADCCSHEHVETTDEADGHEGGLPHEWVSRCTDCGETVESDGGYGWERVR
jgi:hypothetical protein